MKISKILIGIVFLLLVAQLVSAFGISSMYHKNNPLLMLPGETREIALGLQNMVGGEDLLFKVEVIGEVAEIIDPSKEYLVPFGNSNTPVNIRISIPEDTPFGQTKTISVSVKTIPSKDGEMLQMNAGLVKKVPIQIGPGSSLESPKSSPELPKKEAPPVKKFSLGLVVFLSMTVLAAIAITLIVIKRRKRVGKK